MAFAAAAALLATSSTGCGELIPFALHLSCCMSVSESKNLCKHSLPLFPVLDTLQTAVASTYNKLNEILFVAITSNTRTEYICGGDICLLLPWFSVAQNHPIALVHIMGMVFLLIICKSLSIMPLPYM